MGLINFLKQKFSKHKDEKPSEAAAPSQKEEPKKEDTETQEPQQQMTEETATEAPDFQSGYAKWVEDDEE